MAKLYWLSSSLIFALCITTALSRPRCGVSDVADSSGPSNFEVFDLSGQRKFKNRDLTYLIKYPNKLSLSRSDVGREIARAFKSWSDVTNLRFRQVHHEDAEIRIAFHGNVHRFEGKKDFPLPGDKPGANFLAHAFPPTDGRLHFDITRAWKTGRTTRKGMSLYRTALHEIGHILGLDHSKDNRSIMWKNTEFETTELNDDDIAGIQSLYGKPVSRPSGPADCTCSDFISSNGYGNCQKKYQNKSTCYVNQPSNCGDLKFAKIAKRYWSFEACKENLVIGFRKERATWCKGPYGGEEPYNSLDDAIKQCRVNSECVAVWDSGCDDIGPFSTCLSFGKDFHDSNSPCIYKKGTLW